jgi:hypothetical protein
MVRGPSILAPPIKNILSLTMSPALGIGEIASGENHYTTSPAYDTAAKVEALITAESYAEPPVKAIITTGFSARRGLRGHEPAVMWITAGYHGTIGEGGSRE